MAFPQRGGNRGFNRNGQQYTSVRLTGLFATSKQGLMVGTVEGEALDGLIEKIKEAKAQGKGVSLFVKEVTEGKGAYVAQVFADVDKGRGQAGGGSRPNYPAAQAAAPTARRPIQPDPNDGAYDPFAR